MGRFTGERDTEIMDQLEDFIVELLGDSSPLMSLEARKEHAKELKKRAFEHIEDQVHGLEKDMVEKINEREQNLITAQAKLADFSMDNHEQAKHIEDQNSKINDLEEQVKELDLELKATNPTRHTAKKFGFDK